MNKVNAIKVFSHHQKLCCKKVANLVGFIAKHIIPHPHIKTSIILMLILNLIKFETMWYFLFQKFKLEVGTRAMDILINVLQQDR